MKFQSSILFFLFLYSTNLCFAQESACAKLKPEASELGYKSIGERCEGFFVPKYSSNNLKVVALTFGEIRYSLNDNTVLKIKSDRIINPINTRGTTLNRGFHYQMDAVLNPKDSIIWSAKPYLYNGKRNITDNKLGVYGWIGKEDSKIFVPIRVTSLDDFSERKSCLLKIIPNSDLTHFRWRVLGLDENFDCKKDLVIKKFQNYKGDKNAGDIIEISLFDQVIILNNFCIEIHYRSTSWEDEMIKVSLDNSIKKD